MTLKHKSRLSKLMTATLIGSIGFGGLVATMARAGDNQGDAAAVQALVKSKVTLADAIRTAEAAGQGTVTGAEFLVNAGGTYFDVTTQSGTTEIDHRIDPATGKILSSMPVDPAATEQGEAGKVEGQEKAETGEGQDLAAIQGAQTGLLKAITDAEAQGGRAISAEFSAEKGSLAVDVKVADATGKVTEMVVDAATGKVVVGDQEQGGEGNEGGENQEG